MPDDISPRPAYDAHHYARKGRGKIYDSIVDTIGDTPLVRLPRLTAELKPKGEVVAKLEFFNPINSVKDRIGAAMIEALELKGLIKEGTTIVEPTSGNTGIALAFVAAAKGYKLILVMPESMSIERRKMLLLLGRQAGADPGGEGHARRGGAGAGDHRRNPRRGDAAAVREPRQPRRAPRLHRRGDLERHGRQGGCGDQRRRHRRHHLRRRRGAEGQETVGEDDRHRARSLPVLSGGAPGPHKIQGIGAGFVPGILDRGVIDEVVQVGNDESFEMARRVARTEGIPVGISSGAAISAAFRVAARDEYAGKLIVAIIPSFAERYLSTALFEGL